MPPGVTIHVQLKNVAPGANESVGFQYHPGEVLSSRLLDPTAKWSAVSVSAYHDGKGWAEL